MKPGANKSLDDCYEYDIDSWLQYAADDALDKGCCPDFFGYWSSSPFLPQGQHVAVADMGFSEIQGSLNKAETSRTKERTGTALRSASSEAGVAAPLLKATNATAGGVLASRGAESSSRATGGSAIRADGAPGIVLPQSNRDAFITKARASMAQTFSVSQTNSIPVVNASSVASLESCAIMSQSRSFHLPSSRSLENPTTLKSTAGSNRRYLHSIVDELRNQQQQRPQPMAGLRSQVSNAIAMGMRTTQLQPHTMPFSSCSKYPHGSLSHPPTQHASNPQESGCSHVTNMPKMSDNTSSASNQWDILQQRVTSSATTDSYADGSEMEPSSSVQGLRVGTTSSIREELCTGKRKQDDECPSEDAEGESMETRHLPKFSSSKRNRAAEVHNLSEKNRRNRINEKLKTLQDLIPNSSKTDKASILDEAIDYLKTLQMQLQMVSMRSGIAVSPMMIPVGMPHLQMAPLHSVGIGVPIGHAGMGIGMGMGMGVGVGLHMSAAGMGMNMVMPQVTVNPSSHQSDPSTRIHSRPASHDRVLNSLSDDGEVPTISDFNLSESMQSLSQTEQFEFAEPGSYATFDIPHHRHQL